MLSRYIDNFDFKSRFRILKGGKVSLVVSAMIVGSIVNVSNAETIQWDGTAAPYLITPSMEANTTIEINGNITTNNNSAVTIDATNSVNGNTLTVNNSGFPTGISIIGDADANALSGINIYNLSTPTDPMAYHNINNQSKITISNIGGNSFGVTSITQSGLGGNWNKVNILNQSEIDVSGIEFAEGIFVEGNFINGSIENSSFGVIYAHTTDEETETYGIDISAQLINSTITNDGTIESTSANTAYGIYINDDTRDSKITNNGEINVDVVRDLVNADMVGNTNLYSDGIHLNRVMANTDNILTEVQNSDTIDVATIANITATGTVYTYDTTVESKGIYINFLSGDSVADTTAFLTNNGEITATSKLDVDFTNEGDSISTGYSYFHSTATGIEVTTTSKAQIINNLESSISASAEISVDEKGTISDSYIWAESNGIKSYELEETMLINNGSINSTSTFNGSNYSNALANGIYVDGDVDSSTIMLANEVTVKAEAKNSDNQGDAYANANGLNIDSNIENTSTIGNAGLIDVESKVSLANYGTARAYGFNFDNSIYDTQIMNVKEGEFNGQIVVDAESTTIDNSRAYANGIYAADGFYDSGIQNSGDIIVTAKATSEESQATAEARGIYAYDFGAYETATSSTIINSGKLEITAEADSYDYSVVEAYGIEVITYGAGEITNNGTITVNANATITDDGYMYVDAYGISASHDVDADLTLENTGTIEAYINDKLDENGYSLYISSEYPQSVTVTNSGILKGNIYVDGTLTNNGTSNNKAIIELAHNAMDEDSAYIKNFTNDEHGILRIGLLTDGTIGNTKYSQLNTQSAVFNDGSTIDVNVLSASTNSGLLAGNKLADVVTASGTLTDNGLVVTDNSALLNFQKVVTEGANGKIDLNVVQAQTVSEAVTKISTKAAPTQYANAQGAAKALDKIIDNIDNNPQMESVITRLNQLPTNESVAKAVESTTPVATNATVGATTQISNGIAGIVSQRQNANISSGGMNSGDGMFSENNLWIKPFGSIGSQNDKDGINGFDLKTYGLGFGADTEYKDNQKVGLAFFYTNGNLDVNNMNQNADLDVFTTLVYGNVPVIDDKTNFLYQAGYSWQNTQTDRGVFTGETAESKYTSKTASLDLKLMRDVNVNNNLLLQPLVNTTYRHFTNPEYNETGAGALNLNVDKFKSTDLIVGLGTLAHYKLTDDSKIVGNVNVGYDLNDKNQTITSAYEGASGVKFGTDGIDNGRWSYEAGIGYEMDINKTNNINVSYDYQGQGKDFSNNVVSAKYVLKF